MCVCFVFRFNHALREKLDTAFPDLDKKVNNSAIDHIVHMHFKEDRIMVTYKPLLLTYSVLLLYMYFSVRKYDICIL